MSQPFGGWQNQPFGGLFLFTALRYFSCMKEDEMVECLSRIEEYLIAVLNEIEAGADV